jgi:hypothetical protein
MGSKPKKKSENEEGSGAERRQAKRRPVIESFSLFLVVPSKGVHRLRVHDVSEIGIGFDLDLDGESFEEFPVQKGQRIEIQLYLNQSLSLPLSVTVARVQADGTIRRIGAQFEKEASENGQGFRAYRAFVDMIDALAEVAEIQA